MSAPRPAGRAPVHDPRLPAGDGGHGPGEPGHLCQLLSPQDVLLYTTPAFQQEMEVTGPVSLDIYVSSSAVDTDFTGKLVDVWPDGFSQNLTDGILRARYRSSTEKAELMNPGEVYRLTIEHWSTSNVFLPGHKLRVEVASGNLPRFDRTLNTGASPEASKSHMPATNVVYHDRDHPSALILPVLP